MGHLNSFSASRGGNFNKNFPKIQMPGGLGMFTCKLRFDWYISLRHSTRLFNNNVFSGLYKARKSFYVS